MKRSGILSPRCNVGARVLTSLGLAVMLSLSSGRGANQVVAQRLPSARTLEREMTGAETHRYQVDLKANEFLQVRVEQEGIDVVLKLLDVNAKVLATMDSPNGKQGPEVFSFVAETPGGFVLEFSSLDPKAGRGNYSIRREASRLATAQDRRRVAVERAFVEGVNASVTPGQSEIAVTKLEEALAGWQELGDGYLTGLTTQSLTQLRSNAVLSGLYQELNKAQKALAEGQQLSTKSRADSLAARTKLNGALEAFRSLRVRLQGTTLIDKLNGAQNAEQLRDSLKSLEFASMLGEGLSLSALAQTHNNLGEWKEYVDYLKLALETYQKILADNTLIGSSTGKKVFVGLKGNEAGALNNLGGALDRFYGRSEEALQYLGTAADRYHALYQETQDRKFSAVEAATLMQMGQVHSRESKGRAKAIEFFNRALEIYRSLPDEKKNVGMVGMVLASIALQQALDLSYESALRNWREALEIYRDIDDLNGQSHILYGESLIYWVLADKPKLKECVDRNLAILQSPGFLENWKKHTVTGGLGAFQEVFEAQMESFRLTSIAFSYRMLEDYMPSLEYYQKALVASRINKEPRDIRLAAAAVAYTFAKLEKWNEATKFYKQALEMGRAGNVKQDVADDLADLGWALLEGGNPREALEYQNEALAVFQSVGIDGTNSFAQKYETLLNEVARTHYALGSRRLAILYGKRGVNAIQGERQRLRDLDLISQKSFLESKEKNYRRLADWLIEEGRLPEAEKVLDMLKQEEFSNIRQRGLITMHIRFTPAEDKAGAGVDQLAVLAGQRSELLVRFKQGTATSTEKQKLDLVEAKITAANKEVITLLAEVNEATPDQKELSEKSSGMMATLRGLGAGTVALYTVVTDKKGWVILTTPDFRRVYPIDVTDLHKNVSDFRQTLKSESFDPVKSAQKLYKALFLQRNNNGRTLAADLKDYRAKTLMWSLDGVLRYVPIAALHDGQNYLVQRFRNVVFTTTDLTRLAVSANSEWSALGLGVSKSHAGFAALQAVPRELHSIIRELQAGASGVLPGVIRLDEAFTRDSLIDGLREGRPVLHIASHVSFDVGRPAASFLLLGDGNHLTLEELQAYPSIFESIELLTLSACDTALAGNANGKDAEGFAYAALSLGAKSVVGSLWSVSDEGTEVLMLEFYRIKSAHPQMSKAEALQRAQLALIVGAERPQFSSGEQRKATAGEDASGSYDTFKRDPKARFGHPHFWAPFVLIGNWK